MCVPIAEQLVTLTDTNPKSLPVGLSGDRITLQLLESTVDAIVTITRGEGDDAIARLPALASEATQREVPLVHPRQTVSATASVAGRISLMVRVYDSKSTCGGC